MPSGVIENGWSYVVWAYGITGVVLTAYALALHWRLRRAEQDR